jgi:hypothetical protein
MNKYQELRSKQQAELNAFPMFFAFNQKQFEEGMKSLGLKPTDTKKIYSIGYGGYYRKSDAPAFHEMFQRHTKELEDAIAADPTGDGFIFDMFDYELANHEYNYTRDPEPTLDALGMTLEQIRTEPRLFHGWKKATRYR